MWRSRNVLALASALIPLSLLMSFILAGILPKPMTISETVTLEAVERKLERPSDMLNIDELVQSSSTHDSLSFNTTVHIHQYDDKDYGYGGSDVQGLTIAVNASVSPGHIENVYLSLNSSYEKSQVWIPVENLLAGQYGEPGQESIINLTVSSWEDAAKYAFINLKGLSQPNTAFFWTPVYWVLRSTYDQTHQLEVFSELTYFNGSAYKKVIQPFRLMLAPDSNNGFETAEEISEGNYSKSYLGGEDATDFYRIFVVAGQRIRVSVESWPSGITPDFSLHLYDPEQNPVVQKGPNYFETVEVVAESTGFWFIEVRIFANHGYYSLEVKH